MAATKKELEDAFLEGWKQGQIGKQPMVSARAYVDDQMRLAKNERERKRRDNASRGKALIAECKRRTTISLAEADRPAPPYTKD